MVIPKTYTLFMMCSMVAPLEITAQKCTMNTWYQLLRSGFKPVSNKQRFVPA